MTLYPCIEHGRQNKLYFSWWMLRKLVHAGAQSGKCGDLTVRLLNDDNVLVSYDDKMIVAKRLDLPGTGWYYCVDSPDFSVCVFSSKEEAEEELTMERDPYDSWGLDPVKVQLFGEQEETVYSDDDDPFVSDY